jgi:hypothetical protein
MQSSQNVQQSVLDHVVLGCADLDRGVRALEQATGIRAQRGGSHAGWGTHNALATAGGGQYVELLAPDPAQPAGLPGALPLIGLQGLAATGWCLSCHDLDSLSYKVRRLGFETDGARPFERMRPDGVQLRWRLLHLHHPDLPRIAPFFIDWGDTQSPGAQPPSGLHIADVGLFHPDPAKACALLSGLGVAWPVRAGPPALRLSLAGPSGRFVC